MMDFFQGHAPLLYKFIKKGIPRWLKQPILQLLTSKEPELMYEDAEAVRVAKGAIKISFIISRENDEPVDLLRMFGFLLFSFNRHKEFLVVSKSKPLILRPFHYQPKIVRSLDEAVLKATGDYLFFVGSSESFTRLALNTTYQLVTTTKADIYFGNYVDDAGELVRVHNPELKYAFDAAALPVGAAFGPKIVSRELAARVRLPRKDVFTYLLEATDKTNRVVFIEKPLVKSSINAKDRQKLESELVRSQEETLSRRYIYSKDAGTGKTKKVLFIAPFLVFGGAEKVLYDLSCGFIKRGIKVDIFCTHRGGEWKGMFEKAGVRVFVSKKADANSKINEIHFLVKKEKYDVIHTSNTEYGHFYAGKARELPYRPIFIDTVHSQNNPLTEFTRAYQASIDKIITVNKLIKDCLKDCIAEDKLTPVLNGVNVSVEARDVASRFKDVEISFLARISEEKNPLQFVRVASRLVIKHPAWKFKVIGDGPMLEDMKVEAMKLGILEKINFLGGRPEGVKDMSTASCLIISSYTEGLPITLLEALSLGLPVVSSNVGGISEALTDGDNGYFVSEPDATDSYVEKIERMFSDQATYKKMSERALASSVLFTSDRMTESTLSVYSEARKTLPEKFKKVTTIAMLSFNRTEEIRRTIETIYKNTDIPFNLLVLDNNSEKATRDFLNDLEEKNDNLKVLFETKNLGCPGGRRKMLDMISSDYIVTIDNDMEVPKFWLRDLIMRIEEDKNIMGVCVKDIFPWGKVEFTGGKITKDERGFSLFNATYYRKNYNDLSTLEEFDCDWIPGGATLWRGNILDIAEHSPEYINAFEDFDYSLQIVKKGYRIVNCPSVIFIHNHASGYDKKKQAKESKYLKDRNDQWGFLLSLAAFYKRTGHIMRNDKIFEMLKIPLDATPQDVEKTLKELVAKGAKDEQKSC